MYRIKTPYRFLKQADGSEVISTDRPTQAITFRTQAEAMSWASPRRVAPYAIVDTAEAIRWAVEQAELISEAIAAEVAINRTSRLDSLDDQLDTMTAEIAALRDELDTADWTAAEWSEWQLVQANIN